MVGHLARQALAEAPLPHGTADKWTILKDLTAARAAIGVSDRDLAVLSALISFHQSSDLVEGDTTIVFPSNKALSERAHGMAESTLRRHLAALVAAGLILRHDSPNGKRYAARDLEGGVTRAFGFDLRPLVVRLDEITQAAREARDATERLRRQREAVVLRLRDAAKLIEYGQDVAPERCTGLETRLVTAQKALRRKLDAEAVRALDGDATSLLADIETILSVLETVEMSGTYNIQTRLL